MHACMPADAQSSSVHGVSRTMAEWSMMDREWPPDGSYNPYSYGMNAYYQEYQEKPPSLGEFFPPQAQEYVQQHQSPPQPPVPSYTEYVAILPRGDNPREIRNKAEKQRRDKLNYSISELASIVPPVVAANKKIDKTGVLRLTAHYLRAHQYVFGDSIGQSGQEFTPASTQVLLSFLGGFLITTTYKGLIVVVSQNIQQYLGHAEFDLLGQNIFNYIHPEDHQTMRENLMPKLDLLGPNGELLIPDEPDGKKHIAAALAGEKRRFLVRFKKHTQRSEPAAFVPCFIEGTLRKSDKACRVSSRCCQVVRRARARGDNPCSSGNDVVFIGVVRPATETFVTEQRMEAFRMEYRTRHSVDGEIMECEQRISLVAGYMTHEVNGVNAMTFIHRDDVRWVIFALREMYDQHRLVGESCYRLMAKSGQFIYMKTRGVLDVDEDSRAVRSFVCTNTVVDEEEGKNLIKLMKRRCMIMVQNQRSSIPGLKDMEQTAEIIPESIDDEILPVQDLEKEILNLITDLPSPQPADSRGTSPDRGDSPSLPLAIIPPRKERTLSSIERIYNVIKASNKKNKMFKNSFQRLKVDETENTRPVSPSRSPVHMRLAHQTRNNLLLRQQLDGMIVPGPNISAQENTDSDALQGCAQSFFLQPAPTGVSITITDESGATMAQSTDANVCGPPPGQTSNMAYNPNQTSRKRGYPTIISINKKANTGTNTNSGKAYALVPLSDPFEDLPPNNLGAETNLDMIEPSIYWDIPENE